MHYSDAFFEYLICVLVAIISHVIGFGITAKTVIFLRFTEIGLLLFVVIKTSTSNPRAAH